MSQSLVIAIDGPSGSGKSTTARMLAEQLQLGYLDTGAMYRAVAWEYLRSGGAVDDADAIVKVTREADLRLSTHPDKPLVTINGHDVTTAIRDPQVSASVSVVATNTDVRRILTKRMREIIAAHHFRIVVEGRDITTVVAPDADVRILLVADPAARVARRSAELGKGVDHHAVTDQVIRRDRDDSTVSNFTDATEGVVVI
ncbi:MAG: (d)CMP kinase, partial [Propionibacteriaceae bacterium]|nr:(d)CMP kinase [Propionibacteriaceae bacterium]